MDDLLAGWAFSQSKTSRLSIVEDQRTVPATSCRGKSADSWLDSRRMKENWLGLLNRKNNFVGTEWNVKCVTR